MIKLLLICLLVLSLDCWKWKKGQSSIKKAPAAAVIKPKPTVSKWSVQSGQKVYCDVTYKMRWDKEFQKSFDCNWNYENPVCAYGYSNKKIQKYSNPCTACFFNLKVNYFIKGKC